LTYFSRIYKLEKYSKLLKTTKEIMPNLLIMSDLDGRKICLKPVRKTTIAKFPIVAGGDSGITGGLPGDPEPPKPPETEEQPE
jgi:hypothetical protein